MADTDEITSMELDTKTRVFFLSGPVNVDMLVKTWSGITSLSGSRPITIFLNSDGGDLSVAWAIYDFIKSQEAQINIVVLGSACSAATIILQAADVRMITPHSYIMIHKGSYDISADVTEDEYAVWMQNANFYQKKMYEIYADRMNQPVSKIKKLLTKDNIYVGANAITEGLVDEIWD
jgi:ATP-dependent Clp protease protease subunit